MGGSEEAFCLWKQIQFRNMSVIYKEYTMQDNCHPNLSSQPGSQLFTDISVSQKIPCFPNFTKTAIKYPNFIPNDVNAFLCTILIDA